MVRQVIEVNLLGAYWMALRGPRAQACGRVMQPDSSIVDIGSVLDFSTDFGMPQAAYCSSKAAIVGLTQDLAQQWSGRKGIRVNAIAPAASPPRSLAVSVEVAGQLSRKL
jgi:NAD(P)-dependent dehydrogenase (short-subunit alcohol dehydrogenase family)